MGLGRRALLRLPNEELLQQWALQWPDLLRAANWYYVAVHFPLTLAFLAWGWLRRPPEEYRWARRLIIILTALALVVHVLMPLAPPRMLSSLGFLDTMAVFGPSAYGDSTATIANQFAAMPSLHVGWALLIAVVVVRTTSSRWRWIAAGAPRDHRGRGGRDREPLLGRRDRRGAVAAHRDRRDTGTLGSGACCRRVAAGPPRRPCAGAGRAGAGERSGSGCLDAQHHLAGRRLRAAARLDGHGEGVRGGHVLHERRELAAAAQDTRRLNVVAGDQPELVDPV